MTETEGKYRSLTLKGTAHVNESNDEGIDLSSHFRIQLLTPTAEHLHADNLQHLDNPLEPRRDLVSWGTIAACIYSTLMSGLYLGVVIV